MSSSKNIASYFKNRGHDLSHILLKVRQLQETAHYLAQWIEPSLHDYYQVANLSKTRLVLLAANSSIATQLKLLSADLLIKCKQVPFLASLQEIHCIVRPAPTPYLKRNQSIKKIEKLSEETSALIDSIADSIEDPKLRAIMKNIASRKK